jgi:hypothetical protein
MAWVWERPIEELEFSADIDNDASAPASGYEYLSDFAVDPSLRPVFRSRAGLKKFKRFHCPPIGVSATIDSVWRDIVLKFVPAARVQFLPIRLIARGEVSDDFMWVIPFDRVRCIDTQRSEITSKVERSDITLIYGVKSFVHVPNCLGSLHLAVDEQMSGHMLISNELKDALSATGEDSMFYKPEDVWTLGNMADKLKAART